MKYLNFILILFCNKLHSQNLFNGHDLPKYNIKYYKGYITRVSRKTESNHYIWFNVFTEKCPRKISYKYKNGKIFLDGRLYKIVFWGSIYGYGLDSFFCVPKERWIDSIPHDRDFKTVYHSKLNDEEQSTIQIGFNAFKYSEYKKIESNNVYNNLSSWHVVGHSIYPRDVGSNIDYLIATCFFKM